MLSSIDSETRSDIVQSAVRFSDTVEIHSPRNVKRSWDGTREQLRECKVEHEECEAILKVLSQKEVFDEFELDSIDGIVIEDDIKPIVHLENGNKDKKDKNDKNGKNDKEETLRIDLLDIDSSIDLVENVKLRERRRVWQSIGKWSLLGVGGYMIWSWLQKK